MNKIESLRESIKNNKNFTEEFKCNVGTLTDTLVTTFPNYDYSNYETKLSTLKITNNETIENYSKYNKDNNELEINTKKSFEDRIDLQHLFLTEIMLIGSGAYDNSINYDNFNKGLSEAITSTMNNDEGMTKLNPLNYLIISSFSKVINPQILIDSFINYDLGNILVELDTMGITKDKFNELNDSLNKMNEPNPNTGYSDSLRTIIDMYEISIKNKLSKGIITYDDLGNLYDNFRDTMVPNRSELISLYPHHDFKNIEGLENINDYLDKSILKTESLDIIDVPVK